MLFLAVVVGLPTVGAIVLWIVMIFVGQPEVKTKKEDILP